jgi:Cys-rich protein (TIGR01571 family)
MVWNMIVLTAAPPVRCYWRWRLRRKYVVKGMVIGDILNVLLCYICSTLQEAREVRVFEDEMFTAMKRIDGARLPT